MKNQSGLEDEELVINFLKDKTDKAFSKIYYKYNDMIFKYVKDFLYCSEVENIEEIVDDVFVRVYFKLDSLKDYSKLRSWIYTIAHNLCRNYVRSPKNRVITSEVSDNHLDVKSDLENNLLKKELNNFIYKEIQKYDDKIKEMTILRFYHFMPYKEISEIVGFNEGRVKYHIKKVLQEVYTKIVKGGL